MKNIVRRLVTIALTLVLLLLNFEISSFAYFYSDVPSNRYYYFPVDRVTDLGFMEGSGSGSNAYFNPNGYITRGYAAAIFARVSGEKIKTVTQTGFTDVPASHPYASEIKWAKDKGVMSGTSSTTFSPNTILTREQMCVCFRSLKNYLGYVLPTIGTTPSFNDANSISSWAYSAVMNMANSGVVVGDQNGNFNPQNNIMRRDMATMLYCFWDIARYKHNSSVTPIDPDAQETIDRRNAEYDAASFAERIIMYDQMSDVFDLATLGATGIRIIYPLASEMLFHYLDNIGTTYNLPLASMLTDDHFDSPKNNKVFTNEFNDALKMSEILLTGRSSSIFCSRVENSTEQSYSNSDNNDWFLSLGSYRYRVYLGNNIISGSNFTNLYYYIYDYYDFDPNTGYSLVNISFEQLQQLHYLGMARNYSVFGCVKSSFYWNNGQRIGRGISYTLQNQSN